MAKGRRKGRRNYNLIIYIFIFTLLSSLAYGLTVEDPNLMIYWNLEGVLGNLTSWDGEYGFDCSLGGDAQNADVAAPGSTYSMHFDGTNDFCINDSTQIKNAISSVSGNNWGLSFWIKRTDALDYRSPIGFGAYSGPDGISTMHREVGIGYPMWIFQLDGDVGDTFDTGTGVSTSWQHWAIYSNATSISAYLDNSPTSTPAVAVAFFNALTKGFMMGGRWDAAPSDYFGGLIDDVSFWNRSFTRDDIEKLFTEGIKPPQPPPGTIEVNLIAPSNFDNNSDTNQTFRFNTTMSNGSDIDYCELFTNETGTFEPEEINSTITQNITIGMAHTLPGDGNYIWNVICNSSGVTGWATLNFTLVIDSVKPTITKLPSNNWKTDNSSILSPYTDSLNINISFQDETDLYQSLINITYQNGTSYYSRHNTSILGKTDNFFTVLNISNWPLGDYKIILADSDPHTKEGIKDYKVKKGLFNNYMEYETEEGITIRIESLEPSIGILSSSTTKYKDRYSFGWKFWIKKESTAFRVTSSQPLTYIESEYKAHLVTVKGFKGNWIDFNSKGLNKGNYEVLRVDAYTYEITIKNVDQKEFIFNSIGGLNIQEEHYKISLGAVIDVWVYDENNPGIGLNATATIPPQFNHSIGNVSPATLRNITINTTELTLNASGFGIEDKSFSLLNNQSYYNFSFNMSPVLAIRITFIDEVSEALIEGEDFSVFLEQTGYSNTFTGITDNPHIITGLTAGTYTLRASSLNYPTREYRNLNVSNETTTLIDVYMINTTLGQQVTFTVRGSGGENLDSANMDFFRVINGSQSLIAQETTDFAGQTRLYLDPNYRYEIDIDRTGYISRNISLEPTDTEYTIILLSGAGGIIQNFYEGVRFRFYTDGIMTVSPPDILNITNTTHNITFEVEGSNIVEIGINFTEHSYTCIPTSCSSTFPGQGNVTVAINLTETGTFNTAYYFQLSGQGKKYVNDGLVKVISFIFSSLDSLPDWVANSKQELSPNLRTLLVAIINVIAVGVGASLGIAGVSLIIPVLAVNIIASLPEIGLIHPFIGMIISIFGVSIYVYSQMR